MKLVHCSSRRTCLCQKHQNMALNMKALKIEEVTTTNNPDTPVRQNADDETIRKINECDTERWGIKTNAC